MSLKIKALCNLGLRLSKNPDISFTFLFILANFNFLRPIPVVLLIDEMHLYSEIEPDKIIGSLVLFFFLRFGVILCNTVLADIEQFLKRSDNSTTFPGKRDTKTVLKEVKQKHVLNDYMMNLYEKYKFENPGIKMSRTCQLKYLTEVISSESIIANISPFVSCAFMITSGFLDNLNPKLQRTLIFSDIVWCLVQRQVRRLAKSAIYK
jgi:hypothetical protein